MDFKKKNFVCKKHNFFTDIQKLLKKLWRKKITFTRASFAIKIVRKQYVNCIKFAALFKSGENGKKCGKVTFLA